MRDTVRTPDGVELAVDITGEGDLTVVLAHGWALASSTWEPLLSELAVDVRVVRYDQRGHGRSGGAEQALDQVTVLGHDLAAVIEQAVECSCVVVGHSMGGMALLSMAVERPDLIGSRVRGAVLVSTSAGELNSAHLGVPLPLRPLVAACIPEVMARLHPRTGTDRPVLTRVVDHLTRRTSFGRAVTPQVVRAASELIAATPALQVRSCWTAMRRYDATAGAQQLRRVPVQVAVGSRDGLTPIAHSRRLAEAAGAPLVVVPHAGHMLHLEAPDVVAGEVATVLARARAGAAAA